MAASTSSTMYRTLTVSSSIMGGPPGRRCVQLSEQELDAGVEVGGQPFEGGQRGAVVGCLERGIGDAPVDLIRVAGEFRAHLLDPVAQCDHDVEVPSGELVDVLGA